MYAQAYRNVRDTKRSNIIEGLNQFDYLRNRAAVEPLSVVEIDFNRALALYRLNERSKFDEITADSNDVRVAQLNEIVNSSRELEKVTTSKNQQLRTTVQQVSFVLITASVLTFLSHL